MKKKPTAADHLYSIDWEKLAKEFSYGTARSGGSGGQHVNKVETKVIVKFDIAKSCVLTDDHKRVLISKLKKRLKRGAELSMYCQATRSQLKNKERVTVNLLRFIKKSLLVKQKRKPIKMSKTAKNQILKQKKRRSDLKKSRQKPRLDSSNSIR